MIFHLHVSWRVRLVSTRDELSGIGRGPAGPETLSVLQQVQDFEMMKKRCANQLLNP